MSSDFEKKILLIDDEPIVTHLFAHCLETAGYHHVRTLNNSKAAHQVVAEYRPDIILLDIEMPEIDGISLLESMGEEIINEEMQVVIISNSNDRHYRRRALVLGAADYLIKPVVPAALFKSVKFALEGRANKQFILETLEDPNEPKKHPPTSS